MGPPPQAQRVQLIRASTSALELSWTSIPNAQYYILEVQKLPPVAVNEKPAIQLKEENEHKLPTISSPQPAPVAIQVAPQQQQPKIIYQPAQAGDKKPMIILQPKKPLQLPAVRAQSVFKVMPSGTQQQTSQPIKIVQKPNIVTQGNIIRPGSFTGNVIKLMPGTILSGNKIIMKPATSGTMLTKPATSQQIIVQRPGNMINVNTSTGIKINTTPRIVTTATQRPMVNIGGRTVTLQLAPGQKKVTLVNAGNATPTGSQPKIIMMPATAANIQAHQQQQQQIQQLQQQQQQLLQQQQQKQNSQMEQLDGALDFCIEQLDGAVDNEDDIESQISTVKIEKHGEGEDVKVTTSGASGDKMEENEAAAILSTISEVSQLSSHSVNTHIAMHDEK